MMKNPPIDTTFRKTVAGLELQRRFVTQLHRKILLKISSYILFPVWDCPYMTSDGRGGGRGFSQI